MKFSINQTELQNALSIVMKGISSRSTLPILSCIYIKAIKDSLVFQSTDLELSIQHSTKAMIEEEGEVVVSGKIFSEIVKNLPDAAVFVEDSENDLLITCESASFSLKTLNVQDFPGFPEIEVNQSAILPFDTFSSMVKKVAKVVSKDESRAILTGVLITVENDNVKMVATDSYRLAITEVEVSEASKEDFEVVIAGNFLLDIATLPKSDENISIALSENQIVVTYQDIVFINRRIEGNFPNYRQLLPSEYTTRVGIDTEQLSAAVKRTSLVSNLTSPIKFNVNKDSETIQVSTMAQDIGTAQETLSCSVEGEDVEIAFNFTYVFDGLNSVSTNQVFLELQTSMKPGIFKADTEDNFLYLVMPVRLT